MTRPAVSIVPSTDKGAARAQAVRWAPEQTAGDLELMVAE